MSRLPVFLSAHAEADIDNAIAWYAERSIVVSERFLAAVVGAVDAIGTAPERWAADGEGDRRFMLRRFPYSVVYFVSTDAVIVLAVAHHRKMPSYWRQAAR